MRKLRSQGPSRSRAPPRAQSPGPKIPQVAKRNAFATCSSAALHARREPCQKASNDANASKRSASTRCSCRGEKEPGARRTVPKDPPKEVLREVNLANRQVARPLATEKDPKGSEYAKENSKREQRSNESSLRLAPTQRMCKNPSPLRTSRPSCIWRARPDGNPSWNGRGPYRPCPPSTRWSSTARAPGRWPNFIIDLVRRTPRPSRARNTVKRHFAAPSRT